MRNRGGEPWPTRHLSRRASPPPGRRTRVTDRRRYRGVFCREVCRPGSWPGSRSGCSRSCCSSADRTRRPGRARAGAGAGDRAPTACVTTRNACVRWRPRRCAKPKLRRSHQRPGCTGLPGAADCTGARPVGGRRKRREYESLFASNVVLSRRPEGERPDAGPWCRDVRRTGDASHDAVYRRNRRRRDARDGAGLRWRPSAPARSAVTAERRRASPPRGVARHSHARANGRHQRRRAAASCARRNAHRRGA